MKSILLCISLVFIVNIIGINKSLAQFNFEFTKAPVVPSPNAAALGKFSEIPVSHSTGVPSINIPFYDFSDEGKGLSLNIGLNYHSGGHRVADMASNVGLGWSLNAGGVISRTLKGLPDDHPAGYINTPPLPLLYTDNFDTYFSFPSTITPISQGVCLENSPHFHTIRQIHEGQLDGEADIFSYSINGQNGKFYLNKEGKVVNINITSNKVIPIYSIVGGKLHLNFFDVITSDGVTYEFRDFEEMQNIPTISNSPQAIGQYKSSWYLSRILSKDKTDTIKIEYAIGFSSQMYESSFYYNRNMTYVSTPFQTELAGIGLPEHNEGYYYTEIFNPKRVGSIGFPNGIKVEFSYDFNRQDLVNDRALTKVAIKGIGFARSFSLNYDYFDNTVCTQQEPNCWNYPIFSVNNQYKRLKLNSIAEGPTGLSRIIYSFEYDNTNLPLRNAKQTDWWGYYNGAGDEQPNLFVSPPSIVPYSPNYVTLPDRPSSLIRTRACVLNRINYGTGGYTRFEYELNEGYNGNNLWKTGGLRVKTIAYSDNMNSNEIVKKFSYLKENGMSSGVLQATPKLNAFWRVNYYVGSDGVVPVNHRQFILNENLESMETLSNLYGSSVLYERVIEENFIDNQTNGKTVYEFLVTPGTLRIDNTHPYIHRQDFDWMNGLIKNKKFISSTNELIKDEQNDYVFRGQLPLDTASMTRNLITTLYYSDNMGTLSQNLYGAKAYQYACGRSDLSKVLVVSNSSNGLNSQELFEYDYDPDYFVRRMTKHTNSKSDTNISRYYYPFDFNLVSYPVMNTMVQSNQVNEVVIQENWIKKGGSSSLLSSFVKGIELQQNRPVANKFYDLNIASPIAGSSATDFDPMNMLRFSNYRLHMEVKELDQKLRVREYIDVSGISVTTFIGNHGKALGIFKGSRSNDCALAVFDENYSFNWSGVNSTQIKVHSEEKLGKYLEGNNISITKSSLNPLKKYIVGYWSLGGPMNVQANGLKNANLISSRVFDDKTWSFYLHEFSNASSVTVSGNNSIDDLFLCPANIDFTITNYNPILGLVSSQTNGFEFVFYNYDPLGRLLDIRDAKGNITKRFCYNYTGQIINCFDQQFMNNQAASADFTRNNCPVGFTGSTLTYSISANTVSSYISIADANLRALQRVQNEGQDFANANGSCNPISSCNFGNCNNNGPMFACINGFCETGVQIHTGEVYMNWQYYCRYHYEWSDGSRSVDYFTPSFGFGCLQTDF